MTGKATIKRIIGPNILGSIQSFLIEEREYMNHRDVFHVWKNNASFKDKHKGQRCFILGNGPSLKDVNLEYLADEFVFSVNNFSQVKNYKMARTNVHLWMDYSFFQMRTDQKYDEQLLMKNYMDIAEEHPICFVPYSSYEFINKKKLDQHLDIHYLYFTNAVNEETKLRYDITKTITGFSTVVQYAIVVAMYMGFSEIYLLGCDSTNIVSMLNCAQNISNENMHAYDNDDVNERFAILLNEWGMTKVFYDQYLLFLGFKLLNQECTRNGIRLVNCSSKTIINEIPRENLEKVLM